MTLDSAQLLAALQSQGDDLVRTAAQSDPDRKVPYCPGWTVRDLVAHLETVYRWAGQIVRERWQSRPDRAERAGEGVRSLAAAHAELLEILRTAPADLACWTHWPAPSGRDYWIRRQTHETAVHNVDLHNAVRGIPAGGAELDPALAGDGVDEMVCGFSRRFRPWLREAPAHVLALHAADIDRWWWIRLGPGEPEFGRGQTDHGTAVSGRAGELLLWLWNRREPAGLDVTGDPAAVRMWRQQAHI